MFFSGEFKSRRPFHFLGGTSENGNMLLKFRNVMPLFDEMGMTYDM